MKRAFKAVESLLLRRTIGPSDNVELKRGRSSDNDEEGNERKRRKVDRTSLSLSPQSVLAVPDKDNSLLKKIPSEVVLHIMTYLTTLSDYNKVQLVCRQFRDLSNMNCILSALNITKMDIISQNDMPIDAQTRLCKYAKACNLEALYMLAMIRAYCYEDVYGAVSLLRSSCKLNHIKSCYALGLMLRDHQKDESKAMLLKAANQGYLPAQQEVYPASLVKAKHGELEAEELVNYLDPHCLSDLLNREFKKNKFYASTDISHCWNPHCGRWAYKQHVQRQSSLSPCVNTNNLDPTVTSVLTCVAVDATNHNPNILHKVSRMKMCSSCRQAKYCSKLCQVYDWRSNRHKAECTMILRGDVHRGMERGFRRVL